MSPSRLGLLRLQTKELSLSLSLSLSLYFYWSGHVFSSQVGGKTADKGAVFTVSNGQLPGERGSDG